MEKRSPSPGWQTAQRNHERDSRSAVRPAGDFQFAVEQAGSCLYAAQSIPALRPVPIQTLAVIAEPQHQAIGLETQFHFRLGAPGVADDIVDALLENQENLA